MSKIIIWLVLGGLVITGGYFGINSTRGNEGTVSGKILIKKDEVSSKKEEKKVAFSELIKQGGSSKCTVSQNTNNIVSQGVTYMSKGMIRGEFSTKVQNMNISSTFIIRDGYTYTWTSAAPTMGFKTKLPVGGTTGSNGGASGQYGFNAEQIGEYDCQPWSYDAAKFNVPTDVTFNEYGAR